MVLRDGVSQGKGLTFMLKKLALGLSILGPQGTRKSHGCVAWTQAFTAIELTGVLAVIALLAASVIPNVIRRIDRATWERETSDLKVMANGLVQTILTDKQIPTATDIPTKIAAYLNMSVSQVTNTPRRMVRRFLLDTSVSIDGGIPYDQRTTVMGNRPTNVRVILLSAIAGPSVSTISDSFANIRNTADDKTIGDRG